MRNKHFERLSPQHQAFTIYCAKTMLLTNNILESSTKTSVDTALQKAQNKHTQCAISKFGDSSRLALSPSIHTWMSVKLQCVKGQSGGHSVEVD